MRLITITIPLQDLSAMCRDTLVTLTLVMPAMENITWPSARFPSQMTESISAKLVLPPSALPSGQQQMLQYSVRTWWIMVQKALYCTVAQKKFMENYILVKSLIAIFLCREKSHKSVGSIWWIKLSGYHCISRFTDLNFMPVAPTSIQVEGYRNGDVVEVAAGSTLHLRCTVPGARPPPSLTWYMQDTQVDQGEVIWKCCHISYYKMYQFHI